jgi:hypothetical protein
MPYYAQRADLPDTHKLWADPGSQHEAVLKRLGYVEVPAPGQSADVEDTGGQVPDEVPVDQPPTETAPTTSARGKG